MESKDEVPLNIVELRERLAKIMQEPPRPIKFVNYDRYYWPAKYPQIELININANKARRAITSVTA